MNTIERLEVQIEKYKDKAATMVLETAKSVLKGLKNGVIDEETALDMEKCLRDSACHAVIDDKRVFMERMKSIMMKSYMTILSIEINIDKDTNEEIGKITTVPIDIGREVRNLNIEDEFLAPITDTIYQPITNNDFAPVCLDVISVKLVGKVAISITNDDGYLIMFASRSIKVFRRSKSFYIDITNGQKYTLGEIKELGKALSPEKSSVVLYKAYLYSPSDSRQDKFLCIAIHDEDNREAKLDKISNGAWSIAKEEISKAKDELSPKELQEKILKFVPRIGQAKASSNNFGEIKSWVYVDVPITTISGETQDGTTFHDALSFSAKMSNYTGFIVTEKAVEGLLPQTRPDGVKSADSVKSRREFVVLLRKIYEDYQGHIHRYGTDPDNFPEMIIDKNALKYFSNFNINNMNLEILAFANDSDVNSCKQMLDKIMEKNPKKAIKFITERSKAYIDSLYCNSIEREASIPTPGTIASGYSVNIIQKIKPDEVYENFGLLKGILTNTLNSVQNVINKLRFPLDGVYSHLLSDISEVLAGKGRENAIIKYGEIYVPKAERYFRKLYTKEVIGKLDKFPDNFTKEEEEKIINGYVKQKIQETVIAMFKYPSIGTSEYYLARPLTLHEIMKRIENLDTTDDIKAALRDEYRNATIGVAIVPSVTELMNQLAGLDFDFDSACFVFDQEFVSMLKGYTQEIVSIEADE